MKSRNLRLFLEDIQTACERVIRYTNGLTMAHFFADSMVLDASIRNLEVIGEATRYVPADIRQRYPDVPWREISAFRNVAIHAYPMLDEDTLWDVVANRVPELLNQINSILSSDFPGPK